MSSFERGHEEFGDWPTLLNLGSQLGFFLCSFSCGFYASN